MPYEEDDIEDAIKEEGHRGSRRRRYDREAIEQTRKLRQSYIQLLKESDEKRFTELLRGRGWNPGSPEFESLLAIWREYQKGRRP